MQFRIWPTLSEKFFLEKKDIKWDKLYILGLEIYDNFQFLYI